MIDRRTFLASTGVVFLAAPLAAEAQPPRRMWLVGVLGSASTPSPAAAESWDAFRQELQKRGYVEGRNVGFERRSSEGQDAQLPRLASELVRLEVDVLVTATGPATIAARGATSTIPIVMAGISDPVGRGLVVSLARPGGNITGVTDLQTDLILKRLELLKAAAPKAVRVVSVTNGAGWDPSRVEALWKEQMAGAQSIGMTLRHIVLKAPSEFDRVTASIARERPDALLLSPVAINFKLRRELAEFATQQRLPSIGSLRGYAFTGSLMSYGPSLPNMFSHAAVYVDKILKGAKPADLPVEQPTKFELVINLKTAKALGLTIPPSLLQRADEVIQ